MNERALKKQRADFIAAREQNQINAMQRVALQIIAGIDMAKLMNAGEVERKEAAKRLTRLIERERLKGISGHWSYDLNRHIALKQSLDRLVSSFQNGTAAVPGNNKSGRKSRIPRHIRAHPEKCETVFGNDAR